VVASDRIYDSNKSLKFPLGEAYGSYDLGLGYAGTRVMGYFQHDKMGRWWPRTKDGNGVNGMNASAGMT